MATPSPASSTAAARGPRCGRLQLRRFLWLALLGLAAGLVLYGQTLGRYGRTGTAYGARVGCSCRFIEGRPLGSCRKDFEAGMGLVTLSEDPATRSVTARMALAFPQTATFQDGAGCQLEPWRGH